MPRRTLLLCWDTKVGSRLPPLGSVYEAAAGREGAAETLARGEALAMHLKTRPGKDLKRYHITVEQAIQVGGGRGRGACVAMPAPAGCRVMRDCVGLLSGVVGWQYVNGVWRYATVQLCSPRDERRATHSCSWHHRMWMLPCPGTGSPRVAAHVGMC